MNKSGRWLYFLIIPVLMFMGVFLSSCCSLRVYDVTVTFVGKDEGLELKNYSYKVEFNEPTTISFTIPEGYDHTKLTAAIDGVEQPYEVEFEYQDGKIRNLTCTCYCNYHCKHEVAVMLELRELLELIEENYKEQFAETEYFAAIDTASLLMHAVGGKKQGSVLFHRA